MTAYCVEINGWHQPAEVVHVVLHLQQRIAELEKSNAVLLEALEKLARLGNGEHYGNSNGNMIARAAIAEVKP